MVTSNEDWQMKNQFTSISLLICLALVLTGCDIEEGPSPSQVPTLSTLEVTDITLTAAKGGGNILSAGGMDLSYRGLVWGQITKPYHWAEWWTTKRRKYSRYFWSNNAAVATLYYLLCSSFCRQFSRNRLRQWDKLHNFKDSKYNSFNNYRCSYQCKQCFGYFGWFS